MGICCPLCMSNDIICHMLSTTSSIESMKEEPFSAGNVMGSKKVVPTDAVESTRRSPLVKVLGRGRVQATWITRVCGR